jgi:hypothetical protein
MKIYVQGARRYKFCMLAVFFLLANNAFGQLISITLNQRIDNANVIFEGKVLSKTSFWNEAHTQIYTANTISVYKIFKGSLAAAQVEIITHGGVVGHDMEQVSHTLQLNIGDVGIFTAIPNTIKLSKTSGLPRLKGYAGAQGFIKYNLTDHSASDPFTKYKNIAADVYPAITKRTGVKITTVKAADFKIQ